jgi:hypothetical protein
VLIAAVAAERSAEGKPNPTAAYDTGLAVAQLTTQTQAEGLHAHQTGGFHADRLTADLAVPDGFRPLAVGTLAAADLLPDETLRACETAARERRPLGETFSTGTRGTPLDLG